MGTGLQQIPFRIPEKWDPKWFQQFIRDVLQLLDARNSIGVGLTVTGDPDTLATYSVDEDIRNLVDQTFVLVSPSTFLPNERIITGSTSITLTDAGPGGTLTIDLADHSIPYDKLAELTSFGVIGRAPHIPGGPEEILASIDGDVLCVQSDALGFTNVPVWTGIHNWIDGIATTWGTDGDLSIVHSGTAGTITNNTGNLAVVSAGGFTVNGDTLAEIAQDAVGTILVDSTTIDFTYSDSTPSITAAVIQSFAYQWTAQHSFLSAGDGAGVSSLELRSTRPQLNYFDTNGTASNKAGGIDFNTGGVNFFLDNDTFTGRSNWLIGSRSGVGMSQITFVASSIFEFLTAPVRLSSDSQELQLGASQDLRLYHDGTNSIIRNDTGALYLMGGTEKRLGIGAQGAAAVLRIVSSNASGSGNAYAGFYANDDTTLQAIFGFSGGSSTFDIGTVISGNVDFYTNNTVRFRALAAGTTQFLFPFRSQAYTVATLPAGTQGDRAHVTDALAPTFLTAIVGGGAVVTPVFYDGTNWVAQ